MNEKYTVSIVTPVHNLTMKIFTKGFYSVINQDYPINKIEWVVVIHNSPDLVKPIKNLCKNYKNIKIIVANNNIRTPSSPRNIGLKNVHGKYVTFLDADDWLLPNCIKVITNKIENSDFDIVNFRREFSMDDYKNRPIADIVLWNQTRHEIIMNRNNYDNERLFCGGWGMVSGKLYKVDLLRKNKILFDESVLFGEDFIFTLEAYHHAKKICILPQFIGYHYFINSHSLVQSEAKSGETLVKYAQGFKKLFDLGIKYGFDMNETICNMSFGLALFMTQSKNLAKEDRIKIKNIMEPYLRKMHPLKVSKVHPKKEVRDRFNFPNDVILNIDKWFKADSNDNFTYFLDPYDPTHPDKSVLSLILEKNIDTDIGQRYDFANIYTFSQYKKKVPLTNYDTYEPLIGLTSKVGESGIFTSEKITNYLYKIESYGIKKFLPCTKSHINTYINILNNTFDKIEIYFILSDVVKKIMFNDNSSISSIYSVILKESFVRSYNQGNNNDLTFIKFINKATYKTSTDIEYILLVTAISKNDVTQIYAPNTFMVVRILNFIRRCFDEICDDISTGRIRNIDSNDGSKFLIKPNPSRANELREIYKKKKSNISFLDIWKKLNAVKANSIGHYQIYTDYLKSILKGVKFLQGPFITPEAMIGTVSKNGKSFLLNLNGAYYEFRELGKDKILNWYELKLNKTYQLIITNFAGLYRYQSKYYIIPNKYVKNTLQFDVDYNVDQSLIIDNVKITDDSIYLILKNIMKSTKIGFKDYSFGFDNDRIQIYLDPFYDYSIKDKDVSNIQKLFEQLLDKNIKGYKKLKKKKIIKECSVIILQSDSIMLGIENSVLRSEATIDAVQINHYIMSPATFAFFKQFIYKRIN